ncbi:condensation domain-containing protein [Streptomyces sp. NPDC127106]|uniref:condensation domain-containing protein n=1 Tax=Streptomyces sp. NPDC127106 TaxID=3345360 RepID=UPI00362EA259
MSESTVPTSLQQESRLRSLSRYGPTGPTAACWRLDGVHPEALVEALRMVVGRHDALRMSFPRAGADPLTARVAPPAQAPVVIEESEVDRDTDEGTVRARLRARLQDPFAPDAEALHRFVLLHRGRDTVFLGMAVDHMVWDGLSLRRFVADLRRGYSRGPAALAAPAPSYGEFSRLQRRLADSAEGRSRTAFWEERFAGWGGYPPDSGLSTAGQEAVLGQGQEPVAVERQLDAAAWRALREHAARERATVFAVTAAALLEAQGELSGRSRVGLVTETHGRVLPGTAATLGLFSHGIPLFVDLDAAPPARRIAQVGEVTMDAVERGVPLRPLHARWLGGRGLAERATAFLYFGVEDAGLFAGLDLPRTAVTPFPLYPEGATRPGRASDMLAVHLVVERGEPGPEPVLHAQFDPAVFDAGTVRRLLDRTVELLPSAPRPSTPRR